MKVAAIIFTYNRSWHTSQVLDALRENTVQPEKLFIFQDGLKTDKHKAEWDKVSELIAGIEWCDCEAVIAERNKGLARSVIEGVSRVLNEFDAVIVLEDDCVPHPLFMDFMTKALLRYESEAKVYTVSGYAWDNDVAPNGTDAYFAGRISSYGWGTWRNRWKEFDVDYKLLLRIKNDEEMNSRLRVWGEDLEPMLHGNIDGKCDSWAVFWALKVIEKGGLCLAAYQSLIDNIGFDGTGVHSGTANFPQRLREKENMTEIKLPEIIDYSPNYQEEFKYFFSSTSLEKRYKFYTELLTNWIRMQKTGKSITDFLRDNRCEKISIWGKGIVSDLLIDELANDFEILSIIKTRTNYEEYRGIKVVDYKNIDEDNQMIIVVPGYDIEKIMYMAKAFIPCKIMVIDEIIEMLVNR